MKKIYFFIVFSLATYTSFAVGETVVVVTNVGDGIAETPSELKPVNPCVTLLFKVNVNIPAGYVAVGKYEWFVNGVSVKITTDPGDPAMPWTIATKPTNVYCNVTYKKSDGTLSTSSTSTTFTPTIKDLNFDNIVTSTPSPNYGCTTNTVSYNLNTYSCTDPVLCDYVYTVVGQYNITWQPPAGWVQTNISANGDAVSFTPDAASAGPLTATIHLPCGYTETKIFNTIRVAQAPTFTAPNFTSCTSSATISINSTCGASDYTYTITGNPGITFTANGQQTLTSASTTVNVSIAGGSSVNAMKAKANYPNSISSLETNTTLTAGKPQPGPIEFLLIDPTFWKIQAVVESVPGATSYKWYRNSSLITNPPTQGPLIQFPIPRDVCDIEYDIAVEAINSCGTSLQTHRNAYVPCDNFYLVSPNPASDNISVSADQTKSTEGANTTFDEIKIYDKEGNLRKYQKFGKVKAATINIAGLTNGVYFIEIGNGAFKERKQLLVQK